MAKFRRKGGKRRFRKPRMFKGKRNFKRNKK